MFKVPFLRDILLFQSIIGAWAKRWDVAQPEMSWIDASVRGGLGQDEGWLFQALDPSFLQAPISLWQLWKEIEVNEKGEEAVEE